MMLPRFLKFHGLIAIASALFLLTMPASADEDTIRGKTYGEWSAAFWQWAEESGFPDQGPAFLSGNFGETVDIDCSANQTGSVWFLAGGGAVDPEEIVPEVVAKRACIDPIPGDIRLFFPLINGAQPNPDALCAEVGEEEGDCTVEEKREIIDNIFNDTDPGRLSEVVGDQISGTKACFLSVEVDEEPVIYESVPIVRTQSPPFAYQGDNDTIADGLYVMLPELAEGPHVISFTGGLCDFEDNFLFFGQDVTYEVEIGGSHAGD